MRRYFKQLRFTFNSFEVFLIFAIERNKCNKHAIKHFKHNISNYMFENNYETYIQELTI